MSNKGRYREFDRKLAVRRGAVGTPDTMSKGHHRPTGQRRDYDYDTNRSIVRVGSIVYIGAHKGIVQRVLPESYDVAFPADANWHARKRRNSWSMGAACEVVRMPKTNVHFVIGQARHIPRCTTPPGLTVAGTSIHGAWSTVPKLKVILADARRLPVAWENEADIEKRELIAARLRLVNDLLFKAYAKGAHQVAAALVRLDAWREKTGI